MIGCLVLAAAGYAAIAATVWIVLVARAPLDPDESRCDDLSRLDELDGLRED